MAVVCEGLQCRDEEHVLRLHLVQQPLSFDYLTNDAALGLQHSLQLA